MSDGASSLGSLSISSSLEQGVAEIELRGELDLASAPALEAELSNVERGDPRRIVTRALEALSFEQPIEGPSDS